MINILGLCRPNGFGQNCSTLLLWLKSSQRQYKTDEQIKGKKKETKGSRSFCP